MFVCVDETNRTASICNAAQGDIYSLIEESENGSLGNRRLSFVLNIQNEFPFLLFSLSLTVGVSHAYSILYAF